MVESKPIAQQQVPPQEVNKENLQSVQQPYKVSSMENKNINVESQQVGMQQQQGLSGQQFQQPLGQKEWQQGGIQKGVESNIQSGMSECIPTNLPYGRSHSDYQPGFGEIGSGEQDIQQGSGLQQQSFQNQGIQGQQFGKEQQFGSELGKSNISQQGFQSGLSSQKQESCPMTEQCSRKETQEFSRGPALNK